MKKIKITKEQFNRVTNLLKEEFPKLKKNIVDKTFQQEFANKNIKNLEEDTDFRIQKDINVKGVNKKAMGKFMKESTGDLKQETLDFINYLYNKNEDLPSYDEICKELESKGILTNVDGKFKLSKSLGSAEEAKKILDDEISNMMGGDKEVAGELDEEEQIQQISFAVVVFNREMAILEGSDGEYYCFYYHEYIDEILKDVDAEEIDGELHREPNGDEVDNDIDYTYADKEITEEALQDYINKNRNKLTIGDGDEGYNDGLDINKIDEEFKNELLRIYDPTKEYNQGFISFLQKMNFNEEPLNEMHGEDEDSFIQRKMSQGLSQKTAKSLYDIQKNSRDQDTARFAALDIANDAATKKANQKANQSIDQLDIDRLKSKIAPQEKPKPIGQYRMQFNKGDREIDEMNTGMAGATGQFTGKAGMVKREMLNVEVVKETMNATPSTTGEYPAPAFKMKKNHTDFAKSEPEAFKRVQMDGGSFVEFNDCVKLNNKPAGTGCSAGAVDGVVKQKKSKGNVSAPSLAENKIYETIAKKTGKTIDEVKRIIESKNNK